MISLLTSEMFNRGFWFYPFIKILSPNLAHVTMGACSIFQLSDTEYFILDQPESEVISAVLLSRS